jgi:dTDP-glucose 4,6-dehydratase
VISNFIKQAFRGDDLTVYGDGRQTRSFCYVSDEIDGILRLARSAEHLSTNIGNPCEFTMLKCAELVLKVTSSNSRIAFEPLPVDDPKQRCPDISKARKVLGWEPKIDLETGLRLSMDYFREALAAEQSHHHRASRRFGPVGTHPEDRVLPIALGLKAH